MRFALLLSVLTLTGCGLFDGSQTTVSGRITDLSTGQPLPGIWVQLEGPPLQLGYPRIIIGTFTDTSGRYRVSTEDEANQSMSIVSNSPLPKSPGTHNPLYDRRGTSVTVGRSTEINLGLPRRPTGATTP